MSIKSNCFAKQLCLAKPAVFLSTLLCTVLLSACNEGASSSSNNNNIANLLEQSGSLSSSKQAKHKLQDFFLLSMGSGYDTFTDKAPSGQTCLANAATPENIIIGNPQAYVYFEDDNDLSNLQNALNVDVSTSIGGDRFGASVGASFATNSKDTDYSTNLVYIFKYTGFATFKPGSLGGGISALTPQAQSVVSAPTGFRAQCGNSFVAQMDAGAVLGVNLSLSFNSAADKQSFDSKLAADIKLAGVAAAIQQAASQANVHTSLTLSAIQQGGEPQKLNDLFGESDPQGNYPIINCGSGKSSACNLMISNIITYSQEFGDQITESGHIALDRLYYSNPTVESYSALGITTHGESDPSAAILAAMRQLTAQYDKAVYDLNFVDHYSEALGDLLDDTAAEDLGIATKKLNNQIEQVYTATAYRALDCYKGYVSSDCLRIRDNIESALEEFQLTNEESQLVAYMESSAFKGDLLNYYGGSAPQSNDYRASNCMLVPTGFSIDGTYAINCNGQWYQTSGSGIIIHSAFGGIGIDISNFSYLSVSPVLSGNAQWINYSEVILTPAPDVHNRLVGSTRVKAQNYQDESSSIKLTALSENPA